MSLISEVIARDERIEKLEARIADWERCVQARDEEIAALKCGVAADARVFNAEAETAQLEYQVRVHRAAHTAAVDRAEAIAQRNAQLTAKVMLLEASLRVADEERERNLEALRAMAAEARELRRRMDAAGLDLEP